MQEVGAEWNVTGESCTMSEEGPPKHTHTHTHASAA